MDIYIDKSNLQSLVQSSNVDKEKFDDCTRMLKNFFNINFTFEKNELIPPPDASEEEKEIFEKVKLWAQKLSTGLKRNMGWRVQIPIARPLNKKSFDNIIPSTLISNVYLIEDDNAESLRDNGGVLISPIGKELSTLSSLIFDDAQFSRSLQIKKLRNWSPLSNLFTPTTDILIIDKYIFSSPEIYQYNVYKLCEELSRFAHDIKLNIIFVTLKENYNKLTKKTMIPDWKTIKSTIRKKVGNINGKKPNVTFVISSEGNFPEHDRIILTNYRYIYSGDSYNYFDSSGNLITAGRDLTIRSHGLLENYESAQNLISDIQIHIHKMSHLSQDYIIGDRESNIFYFE